MNPNDRFKKRTTAKKSLGVNNKDQRQLERLTAFLVEEACHYTDSAALIEKLKAFEPRLQYESLADEEGLLITDPKNGDVTRIRLFDPNLTNEELSQRFGEGVYCVRPRQKGTK
jgi:hypothetical protein